MYFHIYSLVCNNVTGMVKILKLVNVQTKAFHLKRKKAIRKIRHPGHKVQNVQTGFTNANPLYKITVHDCYCQR